MKVINTYLLNTLFSKHKKVRRRPFITTTSTKVAAATVKQFHTEVSRFLKHEDAIFHIPAGHGCCFADFVPFKQKCPGTQGDGS